MSKIGIIIRTHNEAELLPRTLHAIHNQIGESFEIVIVDSGSKDSTLLVANNYGRVKVIEIPRHKFTYGYALNTGIAAVASRVRYIVNLSAHAIPVTNTWLRELVAPLRHDPEVVGVYGKQIPLPEHLSNAVVRYLATDSYPQCYGDQPIVSNNSYFFSNANSAIALHAWKKIPFDESLPYSEDQQWAKAVINAKKYIVYQPTAIVYHSHPDTYRHYFIRRRNEVKAECLIHPELSKMFGGHQLINRIVKISVTSFNEFLQSPFAYQRCWERFCIRIIGLLATYRANWEIKNAK